MSEHNGIGNQFIMGDGLPQGYISLKMAHPIIEPPPPTLNGTDIDMIRALVETAVDKALYPGGTISAHEHRRVEMVEESGKRWRGVLYRVDENATDPMLQAVREQQEHKSEPPPSGICWVGEQYGEDMVWFVGGPGRGTHLVHYAKDCIDKAEQKPETREHRG